MPPSSTPFPTPAVTSRLPQVGTTIFTVMSALATECDAVNLGQGFPDFDGSTELMQAVKDALDAGHNQYPPMAGVPALRSRIADKIEAIHGHRYDPDREITVTAGATQAILTAMLALVGPGDEVIVFDPCYDSYDPAVTLAGGRCVHVPLDPPGFRPDFARLRQALSPRTRALVLNTPHNPTGTVWTAQDMQELADLLRPTRVIVIADEVYEHMCFDGVTHQSVARHPELAARSVHLSSFGKTFHVTGWKVGYAAAPAVLMAEFRKVHQFNVFTVNTPMQHALARHLEEPAHHRTLPAFYQARRDHFRAGLARTCLQALACEGTYFQCVDYSDAPEAVRDLSELAFCEWLTREVGVAAIPLSAFYPDGRNQRIVRLCFAKKLDTLDAALQRLERHLPRNKG